MASTVVGSVVISRGRRRKNTWKRRAAASSAG